MFTYKGWIRWCKFWLRLSHAHNFVATIVSKLQVWFRQHISCRVFVSVASVLILKPETASKKFYSFVIVIFADKGNVWSWYCLCCVSSKQNSLRGAGRKMVIKYCYLLFRKLRKTCAHSRVKLAFCVSMCFFFSFEKRWQSYCFLIVAFVFLV